MASCSLGGPLNLRFSKLDFTKARSSDLCQLYGRKTWIRREPLQFAGLMVSWKSPNTLTVGCAPSSDAKTAKKLEDGLEEEKSTPVKSQITPNWFEVQSLLTAICDTASIAEFELKLGGFRLYVSRDLAWKSHPSPPPSFPASVNTSVEVPESNGSVSTTSLAVSKPVPSIGVTKAFLEKATDEGLVILQSPRVGYFRRSRTIKKKRAPPACKEKQLVKEGQVLCYIEQLGGEIPVESDVSGEVIKILRDDGEPVGYGDALIAILPSFPGIKKLQ